MNVRSIRKESLELWDQYFSDAHRESQYDNEFRSFLDELRKEEESKSEDSLQPWLHIFEDSIQWLANIWGILSRKKEENLENNKLLLSVWSLISSSCNYAVAVRLLVISGIDNPARAAARSLDEHLCTCIAILNSPELAEGFQTSQYHEDTSQFWYENFNTKKLRKHLNAVERSVGIEPHISMEFRKYRDNELSYFSQATHPTYLSGIMASHAIDVSDIDKVAPAIFGKLTASSERTLNHACKSMWYFSRFGFLMLFNEHNGIKPLILLDKEDEMHQMVVIGREVLQELNLEYWEYTKYPEMEK